VVEADGLSKTATSYGPQALAPGSYDESLYFGRRYTGTNADGISLAVGKYTESESSFIIPASASQVAEYIEIEQGPMRAGGSLTYQWSADVETLPGVTSVQFRTPAGTTYTIPQVSHQQTGDVQTSWDIDDGLAEWEYAGSFASQAALNNFGDGTYTFTFKYQGGQQSTSVWFGVPGTSNFIAQPQQEPVLNDPAQDGLFGRSPVAIDWQACTDANTAPATAGRVGRARLNGWGDACQRPTDGPSRGTCGLVNERAGFP